MSYDRWLTTAPDDGDYDVCSVAGCGARAAIDLTTTIHACSKECEEALKDDLWCAECHALTAEGEDHASDCQRGWEEEALEDALDRSAHHADCAKALYQSRRAS